MIDDLILARQQSKNKIFYAPFFFELIFQPFKRVNS
jgi:hypothetical protein